METRNTTDESVRRQLLALAGMSRPQLCDKWRDLYGAEPPNSSREFLRRLAAYRVQELFYGGLDPMQNHADTEATPSRKKVADLPDGRKSRVNGTANDVKSLSVVTSMNTKGVSTVAIRHCQGDHRYGMERT